MKGTAASMSVMKRVSLIFRAKADKALDRMEDPRETLDYSYKQQVEMLTRVRRGVADVATSRKRVELQMNSLQKEIGKRDVQDQEEKLTLASQRLDAKVQSFRTRKETLKATYTAAEAQTRINEAFSGISEEMGDVGLAIQRAEDKTAQMQARAGAIDELLASGALEDHVGGGQDYIQAELDRMGAGSSIDLELERLKGELAPGEAPKEIGAASDGAARPAAGQPAAASAGEAGDPPKGDDGA